MRQRHEFDAAGLAEADVAGELTKARLQKFDQIRAMLVTTALPPTPVIYDMFWRYLDDRNHALSRAVDLALMTGSLDQRLATALHRTHCIAPLD